MSWYMKGPHRSRAQGGGELCRTASGIPSTSETGFARCGKMAGRTRAGRGTTTGSSPRTLEPTYAPNSYVTAQGILRAELSKRNPCHVCPAFSRSGSEHLSPPTPQGGFKMLYLFKLRTCSDGSSRHHPNCNALAMLVNSPGGAEFGMLCLGTRGRFGGAFFP